MLGERMEFDTDVGVISLKQYIQEQSPEKPYKLLILSHDDPLDPNETCLLYTSPSPRDRG